MHENGIIEHKGRVVQSNSTGVEVTVLAEPACASCHAKSVCGADSGTEKLIFVDTPDASLYVPGEEVIVSVGRAMGFKSVIIAYIIPFIVVFAVLLILLQVGVSELASGLTALGLLAVYYLELYLFRSKISKEIVFIIRKQHLA